MQTLAEAVPRHRIDNWLKNIVAGVLDQADVVQVERSELWGLLDSLPVAVLISTDRACSRIVGNLAAQALLQVPLGANLSRSAAPEELPQFEVFSDGEPIHPDDLPMQRAALTGRRVSRSECEIRFADGNRIFIAGHSIPIQNGEGEVCGSIGAFVDVTEQRLQQESNALVAKEMAHRVKNTVSLIQALAHGTIRQQLDSADYETFEQRLVNLAHAQDLIGRSAWSVLSLHELIETAVGKVTQERLHDVSVTGPVVEVSADLALSLSMVFHELATNACKYGALGRAGNVVIEWTVERDIVALTWTETGGEVRDNPKPGFGSKLMQRIFRDLRGGKFGSQFGVDGLEAKLQFAL